MPPSSSAAALGGEVHLDVGNSGDDALEPVDLSSKRVADGDDGGKDHEGEDRKNDDADDHEGDRSADRGGDQDDDEGYSPDRARGQLQAARRGERRAKTRSAKLEKQMVRLSLEVDGLKSVVGDGIVHTAEQKAREAQARYQEAYNRRTKAFEEGKADAWNTADAEIKKAEADYAVALQAADQAKKAGQDGQRGQPSSALQSWLEDNDGWFDPNGTDRKSERAREISRELARDGFDVKSQKHFDELTYRLKREGVVPKDGGDRDEADGADDQDAERKGEQQRDRGPRGVVGGRRDGGRSDSLSPDNNTKVPRELVRNYAAAGFDTNDPKVKQRILTRYNEYLRGTRGTVNVG